MIGFFQEDKDSKSMSRLCMFVGVCGGVVAGIALMIVWAFAQVAPNGWLCAVPVSLMIGGCLPYIFNKINEIKNKVLENPEIIGKIETIVKAARNEK